MQSLQQARPQGGPGLDQGWTKHPELKLEKSRRDERNEKPKFAMMATLATAQVPKRKSGKEDFRPFEWGFTLLV